MGIKDARIILDNPANTYYAGQTVNGRIEYEFDSPKKVRGIYVRFKGEANTSWSESKMGQQREFENDQTKEETREEMHTGHEEYFDLKFYILGSANAGETELPPGTHAFNFTCALPPALPSSFEGKYGHVRYTVKVTLDRPWKFDQDTKMAFTVINPLDLNLNPSYKEPIHIQTSKTFCCLFCASGPLSLDARAPVSGYCPGQVIPVTIHVENNSNVQVHLVKVTLRRVVTYRSQVPTTARKVDKDTVKTVQEGPVTAGATKDLILNVEVPALPPSNLVNCSIIDLDYDLKVECKVSGMHRNLSGKKYVTIGTVPLVSGASAPSAPPQPQPQPAVLPVDGVGGWNVPGGQPPHQSLYPSLVEPVFKPGDTARSIYARGDSHHTRVVGPPTFAPNYPTYTMPPPPLPE